jgi:hypothetical protein
LKKSLQFQPAFHTAIEEVQSLLLVDDLSNGKNANLIKSALNEKDPQLLRNGPQNRNININIKRMKDIHYYQNPAYINRFDHKAFMNNKNLAAITATSTAASYMTVTPLYEETDYDQGEEDDDEYSKKKKIGKEEETEYDFKQATYKQNKAVTDYLTYHNNKYRKPSQSGASKAPSIYKRFESRPYEDHVHPDGYKSVVTVQPPKKYQTTTQGYYNQEKEVLNENARYRKTQETHYEAEKYPNREHNREYLKDDGREKSRKKLVKQDYENPYEQSTEQQNELKEEYYYLKKRYENRRPIEYQYQSSKELLNKKDSKGYKKYVENEDEKPVYAEQQSIYETQQKQQEKPDYEKLLSTLLELTSLYKAKNSDKYEAKNENNEEYKKIESKTSKETMNEEYKAESSKELKKPDDYKNSKEEATSYDSGTTSSFLDNDYYSESNTIYDEETTTTTTTAPSTTTSKPIEEYEIPKESHKMEKEDEDDVIYADIEKNVDFLSEKGEDYQMSMTTDASTDNEYKTTESGEVKNDRVEEYEEDKTTPTTNSYDNKEVEKEPENNQDEEKEDNYQVQEAENTNQPIYDKTASKNESKSGKRKHHSSSKKASHKNAKKKNSKKMKTKSSKQPVSPYTSTALAKLAELELKTRAQFSDAIVNTTATTTISTPNLSIIPQPVQTGSENSTSTITTTIKRKKLIRRKRPLNKQTANSITPATTTTLKIHNDQTVQIKNTSFSTQSTKENLISTLKTDSPKSTKSITTSSSSTKMNQIKELFKTSLTSLMMQGSSSTSSKTTTLNTSVSTKEKR